MPISKTLKKIAFATYDKHPDGSLDDHILSDFLALKGVQVDFHSWKNPETKWGNYDAVILRSTWDYYLDYETFKLWLAKVGTLTTLINPPQTVLWNSDKAYLLELEKNDISVVPSLIASKFDLTNSLEDKLKTWLNSEAIRNTSQLVIKPSVSASSYLTQVISKNDLSHILDSITKTLNHSRVLVQPYLTSISDQGEISLIFYSDSKKLSTQSKMHFSHGVLKSPKKGDFRVQSEFGGSVSLMTEQDLGPQLISLSEKVLKTLSQLSYEWTYARVDLVDWKTEPKVGEIELIEPCLFFTLQPNSAELFYQALRSAKLSS